MPKRVSAPGPARCRAGVVPKVVLGFALLTGFALNLPFAVLVKLGQDHLPIRPGTAAGVTLGLAVSVGGLLSPLLGLIARSQGPHGALLALCAIPRLTLLFALALPVPARHLVGKSLVDPSGSV